MAELDSIFHALSNGTRRTILSRLRNGEARLSDLAEPFDMSLAAASKHIRVLQDAGLLEIEKRGRERFCKLDAAKLKAAETWISDYRMFWEVSMDDLARYLAEEEADK